MIEIIIAYLNERLASLGGFTIYGLSTRHETVKGTQSKEVQVYPAFYNTKGELTPLTNVDGTKGLIYHKKTGAVTSEASDRKIGSCSVLSIREYPMRIIAYFPKNILNVDNNYIEEKIFENISNAIQANNPKTLRSALKATRVDIITKNFSADRQRILSEEIKNYDLRLPTEWAVISIDYTVTIEASERCFEQWACNDVRETPQFYFPKNFTCEQLTNTDTGLTDVQKECVLPTIPCNILTDINILTDAQIECIAAVFCGGDVTVNINGTLYEEVIPGGTLNIPVKNSADTNVGTVNAGVDVTIADSTITVNGGAYGTTPATVAKNVDVENTAGADVGSLSGGKWVIGNSAVTDGNGTVNQVPATNPFTCQRHIEVSFTSDVQEATAGSTVVTFTATVGAGTVTAWLWNFGDGTISTLQNPTHIYEKSGDYTVTVTASNTNPASGASTREAYIHVYQAESILVFASFTTPATLTRKRVIDNYILRRKNGGSWTLADRLWVFHAATSQAATINWKSPGTDTVTLVNSPTFTADQGLNGNGTTSYVQSNFILSSEGVNYTQNVAYYAVYVATDSANAATDIGCSDGTRVLNITSRDASNNVATRINSSGAASATTAVANGSGMWMAIRRGSAYYEVYRNGVFVGNYTTASNGLPTVQAFIGAFNNNGTPVGFSSRQYEFVEFGGGRPDPLEHYNAFLEYRTAAI